MKKKEIGSTDDMQSTVNTSELLRERINNIVPERMVEMKKAHNRKGF